MAQPSVYGLSIEANLPNGQLSLHDYRKFLSQSNDIITIAAEPSQHRRTLKRKPATINLNQAKLLQKQPHHDALFNMYSPVSSAPSSPPPLSFCQSVVTLHGDLSTPVSPSPLPSSTIRSFSRPSSVARSSASQRIESFTSRLKQAKKESAMSYAHHRASSDSMLLGLENSHTTITHNGASFQILNPHKSLEGSKIVPPVPSLRSSIQSGLAEMDQQNNHHKQTMAREQSLLDSMVRPLSASESAILSRAPKSPVASFAAETTSDPAFGALPPVQDVPESPRPEPPRPSEKTPTRTLRQKVSRLFGSAEKRGGESSQNSGKSSSSNVSTLHAGSHQPSIAAHKSFDGNGGDDEGCDIDEGPISHLSLDVPRYMFDEDDFLNFSGVNRVGGHGASVSEPSMSGGPRRVSSLDSEMSEFDLAASQWDDASVEQHEKEDETHQVTTNDDEQGENESVGARPWRRPVYGPHSSNRHQTLHDALSQLNTNRQSGVTYEDITEYIRSQAEEAGHASQGHDRVEKPWQPETWREPTNSAPQLCSRASDGELSTTAPSTRPSIRPFARQAAAFIAGDGLDSASVTSAGTAIDDVEDDQTEKRVEFAMEDAIEMKNLAAQPSPSRKSTMRRAISHRARPLSSNPPDLDVPLFLAESRSSSSLSPSCRNVKSPKTGKTATTGGGHNTFRKNGSSTSIANTSPLASATRAPAPAPAVSLSSRPQTTITTKTGISYHLGVPEDTVHGTLDPGSPATSLRGSTGLTGTRASGGKKKKKVTKRHQQKTKRASGCCCS